MTNKLFISISQHGEWLDFGGAGLRFLYVNYNNFKY